MSHSIRVPKAVRILAKHGTEPREFKAGIHHDVPSEYALHPYAVACGVTVIDDAEKEPETDEELAEDVALAEKGETKDALLAQAVDLGVTVDRRWGLAKLQAAIDAALAA